MTLKMIAIGILALLGLSSVMNPKAFRVFLGGLAALCMTLFFGFVATGDREPPSLKGQTADVSMVAKLQNYLGKQLGVWRLDWDESVSNRSRTIVKDLRAGKAGDPTLEDLLPKTLESSQLKKSGPSDIVRFGRIRIAGGFTPEVQQEQLRAGIRTQIDRYLAEHCKIHKDIGVAQLTHRDLSPDKIKRFYVQPQTDGSTIVWLGFDKSYTDYVRIRGRQIVMKQRLRQLGYACASGGAVLFLAFGSLKIFNQRTAQKKQDYLQTSNISMV